MRRKRQFRNLLLHIISRAAAAALAIAIVFALTVASAPSAQAQTPATGGGWTEKLLHNFNYNGTDAWGPFGTLIRDAGGNLYGTTVDGGAYGDGTVFEVTPTVGGGWTEQVLHSFGEGTDGAGPYAGLMFDAAGNLYGTTGAGGNFTAYCSQYGCGTVFELTPNGSGGWTETGLYRFCSQANCADGQGPQYGSLVLDAAGNLYGTTYGGGIDGSYCNSGCGTVFELTPTGGGGWTEQVLWSFNGNADGGNLYTGLIFDAAGNLYGTTSGGTVFELTPTTGGGWTEDVLWSFNGADGLFPSGLIFDAAGNLYGTMRGDLYSECTYAPPPNVPNCGMVFELTPTAGGNWTETVLHRFNNNGTDGWEPWAGLMSDAVGNLYGTTQWGGTYGYGTVFELTPADPCAKCNRSVDREAHVLPAERRDVLERGGVERP